MTNRHAHILGLMSISVASFGVAVGSVLRTTLIMAGLLAVAAVATILYDRYQQRQPVAQASGTAQPQRSLLTTKRILMLMLAIGIVAYGGGAGTFSSFSAETSNLNSSIASGTLTMSDQVNTGTACLSSNAITADNYQAGTPGITTGACDVPLTLTNQAPGIFGGNSKITIANTGSLDASKFYIYAPYANATLATQITSGATIASLTTTALEGNIVSGDQIELDYGGHTQTITAGANVSPTKTAIAISGSPTADITYPVGTRIYDKSTNLVPTKTDCFDQITTTSPVGGATKGTDLNFNGTDIGDGSHWDSTNTFCRNVLFWVQEQSQTTPNQTGTLNGTTTVTGLSDTSLLAQNMSVTGTNIAPNTIISSITNGTTIVLSKAATGSGSSSLTFTSNYCWYGQGSATSTLPTTNGMCYAPISAGFSGSTTVTNATTTLTFASALRGNIKSGDTITISQTAKKIVTCKAAEDAYIGATSITVQTGGNACTSAASGWVGATGETFSTAATIVDSTINNGLNPDTTDTISNFDTAYNSGNKLELPALTTNGTHVVSGSGIQTLELAKHGSAGDTRVFYVGVFFPGSGGQNALQGLSGTFGLSWHIDQ